MKQTFGLLIFLCILKSTVFAGGSLDEETLSAFKAFENYRMGSIVKEYNHETIFFEGCAGDVKNFNCSNKINMEIKFYGKEMSGKYYYIEKQMTVEFKGYTDICRWSY